MKEVWKPVPGYEGIYSVSNLGNVMNYKKSKRGIITKPFKTGTGYLRMFLSKNNKPKNLFIHRLVCMVFIGKCPKGKQINHKNGIKNDNRLINLEYVTPSENMIHAYSIGLYPIGSKHCRSKLKEKDVLEIRNLEQQGFSRIDIHKKFNVCMTTIVVILLRKTWKHI